jgi:hypothetical protein
MNVNIVKGIISVASSASEMLPSVIPRIRLINPEARLVKSKCARTMYKIIKAALIIRFIEAPYVFIPGKRKRQYFV